MTRDNILRIAQQAGWEMPLTWDESDGFLQRLERFAALITAAEREQCAQVCMTIEPSEPESDRIGWEHGTVDCAYAIRARGGE